MPYCRTVFYNWANLVSGLDKDENHQTSYILSIDKSNGSTDNQFVVSLRTPEDLGAPGPQPAKKILSRIKIRKFPFEK